jgi:hypothetical protein
MTSTFGVFGIKKLEASCSLDSTKDMYLRALTQQAKAAPYLQQIVMVVFVSIVPCISADSDHGWTFNGQGNTFSTTPRSRHAVLSSRAE